MYIESVCVHWVIVFMWSTYCIFTSFVSENFNPTKMLVFITEYITFMLQDKQSPPKIFMYSRMWHLQLKGFKKCFSIAMSFYLSLSLLISIIYNSQCSLLMPIASWLTTCFKMGKISTYVQSLKNNPWLFFPESFLLPTFAWKLYWTNHSQHSKHSGARTIFQKCLTKTNFQDPYLHFYIFPGNFFSVKLSTKNIISLIRAL